MSTSARILTTNQQARRTRILVATRQLVAEHGYDGMIMRDVATLAQVSPTTLYNLYNTKDELLLEALRDSIADGWNRAASDVPALGFDRLMAQMHASAQQTIESPTYAKAIAQALFRANEGDQIIDTLIVGTRHAVMASLKEMQRRKQLVEHTQLTKLASRLIGAFWATYFLWCTGVLPLRELENELKHAYLTTLSPVTRGHVHQLILEQLL